MALTKSHQPIILSPASSDERRRPTTLEWELLRNFITESYLKKQRTVRWILQELNSLGLTATPKILRGWLKKWQIDKKNRRTKTNPMRRPPIKSRARDSPEASQTALVVIRDDQASASGTRWNPAIQSPEDTVASRLDDTSDRSSTLSPQSTFVAPLSSLRIEYVGQRSFPGIDGDKDDYDTVFQASDSLQTRAISRPLNSAAQLRRHQVIGEIASFYDRFASSSIDTPTRHLSERSPHIFFDKLSDGLALVLTNQVVARKLLHDAGPQGSAVLREFDPTLAPILIRYIITWRHYGKSNETYMGYVKIILQYLLRLSRDNENLGVGHPITFLIASLINEPDPAELCDLLCNAITANYVSRPEDRQKCSAKLRILFGEILVSQGRFLDVESWYSDITTRSETTLSDVDRANALRVLAESRRRRGLHREAEDAVLRSLECLRGPGFKRNRAKCIILKQYARFKLSCDLLDSSEELFREAMRTAQTLGFRDLELCIACDLWSLYVRLEKDESAIQLMAAYPNILAA